MGRLGLGLAVAVAALILVMSAAGKGYSRVVLVGADGRWAEVRSAERDLDAWVDVNAAPSPVREGFVRLFFVGPGDFPANPARYYPASGCVALDWPTYQTGCVPVARELRARFAAEAHGLAPFRSHPTVVARVTYLGSRRAFSLQLKSPAALADEAELAFDRSPRRSPAPRACFPFSARWRGPAANARPTRFWLCPNGMYSRGALYPLRRGVWSWFRLNVSDTPRPADARH